MALLYIDDIFAVWTHGVSHLQSFLNHFNSQHPTIKFTTEWSPHSVSFLDTTVSLEDGHIQTDLYQKPTDMHQYLRWDSCHPHHNKTSIPYTARPSVSREFALKTTPSHRELRSSNNTYSEEATQKSRYSQPSTELPLKLEMTAYVPALNNQTTVSHP